MAKPVTIRGAASLRRVLRQAPDDMANEVRTPVQAGAEIVRLAMLARVPRDTGDLAETIKTKPSRDRLSARVGPGVKGKRDMRRAGWRAHFAEYGTRRQPAQPFVRLALTRNEGGIRAAIAAGVRSALLKMASA